MRPKPLIEIGGKPILWHVMKIFEASGYSDFIICCGYKGQLIKSYFVNYFTENYDIMVNLDRHSVEFLGQPSEKWKVTLVDTGLETLTGGRIKRIAPYVADETFCLTYGDGVARLDVGEIVRFHRAAWAQGHRDRGAGARPVRGARRSPTTAMCKASGKSPTTRSVGSMAAFSSASRRSSTISKATRPAGNALHWSDWRSEGELMAYQHTGFWKPMDTLARQAGARGIVGRWQSALEDMVTLTIERCRY